MYTGRCHALGETHKNIDDIGISGDDTAMTGKSIGQMRVG